VSETTATATITVVRTGPLADTATVRYSTSDGAGPAGAIAGVNYTPAAGLLTFAPSATSQTFQVKILPDKVVTGSKTLLLLLSGANSSVAPPVALGPRSSAVLTINNTDAGGTVKVATAAVTVSEAAGAAVITLTRS